MQDQGQVRGGGSGRPPGGVPVMYETVVEGSCRRCGRLTVLRTIDDARAGQAQELLRQLLAGERDGQQAQGQPAQHECADGGRGVVQAAGYRVRRKGEA